MFLSAVTGIAGMALAPAVSVFDLLMLATLFFLAYGFGQALTDCFQTDTDVLSAPYRPLAQGRLRQRDVLVVSLAGLMAGGVVLAVYNPLNVALVAVGVAGLATYTWFKRRWWGGPFYNGWIVVDLCLIGYASGLGATGAPFDWTPELAATLPAVLFGYANFVLSGYFKDVSADRASGYSTMPVVYGMGRSALASDVLAVLALLSCSLVLVLVEAPDPDSSVVLPAMFAAGAAAWTAVGQLPSRRRQRNGAHRAIAQVHGISLFCHRSAQLGWRRCRRL
jgi:4-hydroxybenzoate polyprenyltransferase